MPLSLFRSCFKAFFKLNIRPGLPFLPMVIIPNRGLKVQSQISRESAGKVALGGLLNRF